MDTHTTHELPDRSEMLRAFLDRDPAYEGVFVTGVTTTGIFCRPTCAARKPRPAHVEFFGSTRAALVAGYRPCKRCRPLRPAGETPAWLRPVLDAVEADPTRRWTDQDLRELEVDPVRARRWFQRHHGMTFHAYSRSRRLGAALGRIQDGEPVTRSAFGTGWDSLSGFGEAFQRFAGAPPTEVKDAPLVRVTRLTTPLGPVVAAADDEHLLLLEFADRRMLPTQVRKLQERTGCLFAPGTNAVLEGLRRELDEYFEGRRLRFEVPLRTPGTPFQEEVWEALRRIPPGETRSYAEVAEAVGRPSAVRAVARANGANRVAVLVPCHRVVGSDGKLTGYGGGLWRKKRLLELESAAGSGA